MATPPERPFTVPMLQELFTNHELLVRERARPGVDGSEGVRTVGILGGGTAGWLTALALRAQIPSLEVTVIETPAIPIIGVGEASVPSFVAFLHHYLKLDIGELSREVKPTWKQGIRFEWGLPGDYVFQAPFDWEVNGIGMLGSLAETDNISAFTLQSILMEKNLTPVIRTNGQLQSFLPMLSFAYHLDNERFVGYLTRVAKARGVRHLDAKIASAELTSTPADDGDPAIDHLVTDCGQALQFDLYIDCSGFRSFLLEGMLKRPFQSFKSSLFTDTAVTFNTPHGGKLKPYTTARTMNHGWCWNIPIVESDHQGYVFSSAHVSQDEALAEAKATWPDLTNERVVRFRSGRHDRAWVGNVFAIGNAYAFVEPLESTGLLMITRSITSLIRAFPLGKDNGVMKRFINDSLGKDWDRLRWFLAAHYKFNRKRGTPFWTEVRETADISGLQFALDLFKTRGPLSLLPRAVRTSLLDATEIFFYGLAGLDNILVGQKVPFPTLEREPPAAWRARRDMALEFARRALPQHEAIRETWNRPDWQKQLVEHPSSWVNRLAPYL
ncbi:MAG: tryptophan halogenase family protein [Byssovorax sp.]